MIKHKSIRRTKRKRSGHKRSGHKRSSSKRSGHKRSGHTGKRSGHKRSGHKRSTRRRLYGGGELPSFTPSSGTTKGSFNEFNKDNNQQANQNKMLKGGGIIADIFGAPTGKDCNFDYVAKNAAGFCDVGSVAPKNISTLLQVKENARYDVPKAV